MVIYLPAQSVDEEPLLDELTPREIVRELDKHVVGQATPSARWPSRCATASAGRSWRRKWPKR
jgi:ATP-dependent protease HslVU (ClpYQ) ATPase subunit